MMGLNPLHAAAHVAAGFLSLWKSDVASRAAYYLDPTEQFDPDWETPGSPLCHFCDLPSGHDGPHKDCMCGKCSPESGVPRCVRCDKPLGAVGTVSAFVSGVFCSERCKTAAIASVSGGPRPEPTSVPVAVDDRPPVSPATGLPKFKAAELVTVAAEYIAYHAYTATPSDYPPGALHLRCKAGCDITGGLQGHSVHVAELVVSALVAELTSLAYDQNRK